MFEIGRRYITCGIEEKMPFPIMDILWNMIDIQIRGKLDMDYLQVFKFKKADTSLLIEHTQEKPKRLSTHTLPYEEDYAELIGETVFVIDDVGHSTMLFAYEY